MPSLLPPHGQVGLGFKASLLEALSTSPSEPMAIDTDTNRMEPDVIDPLDWTVDQVVTFWNQNTVSYVRL